MFLLQQNERSRSRKQHLLCCYNAELEQQSPALSQPCNASPSPPTLGTSTAHPQQWKDAAVRRNSDRAALSLGPPWGPDDQAAPNPAWCSHPSHGAATDAPGADHVTRGAQSSWLEEGCCGGLQHHPPPEISFPCSSIYSSGRENI